MAKRRNAKDAWIGTRCLKLLLDENLDADLVELIPAHDLSHVTDMGWQGVVNGKLLQLVAEHGFDALLTADKNMPYQTNMAGRSFCLIVLNIHPLNFANAAACMPMVQAQLEIAEPSQIYTVDGPNTRYRVRRSLT